jgi:hypothetical protein
VWALVIDIVKIALGPCGLLLFGCGQESSLSDEDNLYGWY